MWEKKKMLLMSIFFFSHNVFKRLFPPVCQKSSLCGKGLKETKTIFRLHIPLTLQVFKVTQLLIANGLANQMLSYFSKFWYLRTLVAQIFLLFLTLFLTSIQINNIIYVTSFIFNKNDALNSESLSFYHLIKS